MITWLATIKESSNDHILTPTYSITDDMFGHIKDELQRDYETKRFLIDFWGLNNPDVEWYKLEKV